MNLRIPIVFQRRIPMFKDIVVPMTGTSGDAAALDAAIALAGSFDAHVAALEMLNLPMPGVAPWGAVPDATIVGLYDTLREQAQANVARLRERLDKETVLSEARLVESVFSESPGIASFCARYADLAVVAGATGDLGAEPVTRSYFSSLLLESGRPVLVVPPHCKTPLPPQRVLVAWTPTRESTRALHDAMPLLLKAAAVDIAVIDPAASGDKHGEQPGADIATHLARHGLKVSVIVRETEGEDVGLVLLDLAYERKSDLLVAGGYGHSRLREWALGGVTRELLGSAPIPVLFSH
jgi:nucleotide-binding universal stress UspA family protein